MDIKTFAQNNILVLDGAMGTMLQAAGLKTGEQPETFNICRPQTVRDIHTAYLRAGANMILTNTFGANERKMQQAEQAILLGVKAAREAAEPFGAFVALDVGPIGELLQPAGTLSFDDAYRLFQKQIACGVEAGVDAIYIETMTDLAEARCAVLAAKETCNLPVFCTLSFEANMRTFMGTGLPSMALTLQGMGVDFIGINCSVGPCEMYRMVEELAKWTDVPIVVKPNAGLPSVVNGETVFSLTAEEFAEQMQRIATLGVAALGGCCGTTPEFIQHLATIAKQGKRQKQAKRKQSAVCSASQTVVIDRVRIIGERINPTGKKRLAQALKDGDTDFIISQAIDQVDAGADILDVNVGVPNLDETAAMVNVVTHLQGVVCAPLQIDSSHPKAIEAGLRAYHGKAIVNSVNGEEEVLRSLLPIVKKYGAAVVGLTMDKSGIPKTAEARLAIAKKIVEAAASYGIAKEDVFIDCLALTASAEQEAAYETLRAISLVKEQLGVKTVLGVSNISFGLPARETMNGVFLSMALAHGLDLPIVNPNAKSMVDTIYCYHQLRNIDAGSHAYVRRFGGEEQAASKPVAHEANVSYCIEHGLKEEIQPVMLELLREQDGLDIVNNLLIPALDVVGKKYESGTLFLPQLLSSAEAAKVAFELVKSQMKTGEAANRGTILLATVEGDIHDIGKNIVKVVLENYGYQIIDLGRDVSISTVAQQAEMHRVRLVGLSALMTTTVENMKKTISAIKEKNPSTLVMVGGAVLNEQYANEINADFYAKDAMEAVAIAQKVFGE